MCYRYEAITTRSEIQFQQVEGLVVGEGVTMADLKGTITAFARRMFGQERQVRIRSQLLPVHGAVDRGGHRLAEGRPERRPADEGHRLAGDHGRRHGAPDRAANGGYDPAKVSGFAFGMGPQRMPMLKHAIDDIRQFWENDLRFLRQF